MKTFNLYEFAGLVVPGALFLFLLMTLFSGLKQFVPVNTNFDFTSLGLYLVLSFVIGQLLQGIAGYLQDRFLWGEWKLKPTEWVRLSGSKLCRIDSPYFNILSKIYYLDICKALVDENKISPFTSNKYSLFNGESPISEVQTHRLLKKVNNTFGKKYKMISVISEGEWQKIVYEIEIILKIKKLSAETSENIGHYNFFKGLIICFFILEVLIAVKIFLFLIFNSIFHFSFSDIEETVILGIIFHLAIIISFRRMHRFAINYTRDLFLQFINTD